MQVVSAHTVQLKPVTRSLEGSEENTILLYPRTGRELGEHSKIYQEIHLEKKKGQNPKHQVHHLFS